MVWGDMDHRVKTTEPTGAQHFWELLQDFRKNYVRWPHEAQKNEEAEAEIKAKRGWFEESKA